MSAIKLGKWIVPANFSVFNKDPNSLKYIKEAKSVWKNKPGRNYAVVPVEPAPADNDITPNDRTNNLYVLMVVQVSYPTAKSAFERSQDKKDGKSGGDYSRLIWAMDLAGQEGCNLVAIFTYHENKSKLFDDDLIMRANGQFGPGAIFVVESPPYAVSTWNSNYVLHLNSPIKLVRLKSTALAPVFPPVHSQDCGSHAFLMHGVHVKLSQMSWIQSHCTGLLCDSYGNRCACFDAVKSAGQTILDLDLFLIFPGESKTLMVSNFTSKKFTSTLFANGAVPTSLRSSHIRGNAYGAYKGVEKLRTLLEHVNKHGGWTTMGMGKRGEKSDEAQKQDDNVKKADKLDSAKLTFHLALLRPTNRKVPGLRALKFDADFFEVTKEKSDDESVDSLAEEEEEEEGGNQDNPENGEQEGGSGSAHVC